MSTKSSTKKIWKTVTKPFKALVGDDVSVSSKKQQEEKKGDTAATSTTTTPPQSIYVGSSKSSNTAGEKETAVDQAGTGGNEPRLSTLSTEEDALQSDAKSTPTKDKSKRRKSSYLTRTKLFQKLAKWAFTEVDLDKSGKIDKDELYTGLLLIHLNLARYAGPAATKPVDRDKVNEIFDRMDMDKNGALNESEFIDVMMILCSQIVSRVVIQTSLTLFLVPFLTRFLLQYFHPITQFLLSDITLLTQHSHIPQRYLEYVPHTYFSTFLLLFNLAFGTVFQTMVFLLIHVIVSHFWATLYQQMLNKHEMLHMIPASVRDTLPSTIISLQFSSILIPWAMFKIDAFFSHLAVKTSAKKVDQKVKTP